MTSLPQLLKRVQRTIRWESRKLRYRLGSDVQTLSVGSSTASFSVDTFQEFIRLDDSIEEHELIQSILDEARPDDVFWDIGANIGTHACIVGDVVTQTVAVEARPDTARKLQRNLEANNVVACVYNRALDNASGSVELGIPEDVSADVGSGSYSLLRGGKKQVTIDAVRGDTLVAEGAPPPTLAKIDVEGAENRVIEGMTDAFSKCRTLFCEVHPEHVKREDVESNLLGAGFDSVKQIGERGNQIHLQADRKPELP